MTRTRACALASMRAQMRSHTCARTHVRSRFGAPRGARELRLRQSRVSVLWWRRCRRPGLARASVCRFDVRLAPLLRPSEGRAAPDLQVAPLCADVAFPHGEAAAAHAPLQLSGQRGAPAGSLLARTEAAAARALFTAAGQLR
eukprot:2293391-Pleurochrysis_carterae.AAC.1